MIGCWLCGSLGRGPHIHSAVVALFSSRNAMIFYTSKVENVDNYVTIHINTGVNARSICTLTLGHFRPVLLTQELSPNNEGFRPYIHKYLYKNMELFAIYKDKGSSCSYTFLFGIREKTACTAWNYSKLPYDPNIPRQFPMGEKYTWILKIKLNADKCNNMELPPGQHLSWSFRPLTKYVTFLLLTWVSKAPSYCMELLYSAIYSKTQFPIGENTMSTQIR